MQTTEMLSLEQARALVLSHIEPLDTEVVSILEALDRVSAEDLTSDIDVAPFAHSAMDGFALKAEQIAQASEVAPVHLKVIAEIGAGDVYDGPLEAGQCIRIMTGAELPSSADSVVKYEIVENVEGDGHTGSVVSFSSPCKLGSNVRAAGEEARAGEVVVRAGEVIKSAGVGYLASCGNLEIATYRRPRVAIMATGSELVDPSVVPGPGHIRESNSFAMAACIKEAGAIPYRLPIVEDTFEALADAVVKAAAEYDFVITTGGAANGDYDFIKKVVESTGELYMTLVNMRPGKAQTFGKVGGTPVFGLPGNPAAAYCGFQMIVRPALRKMQGYAHIDFPVLRARLTEEVFKKDPRLTLMRSTFKKEDGQYVVTPARNQSSGLFGVIQHSNCMIILPEGSGTTEAGSMVECIMMDISEDIPL